MALAVLIVVAPASSCRRPATWRGSLQTVAAVPPWPRVRLPTPAGRYRPDRFAYAGRMVDAQPHHQRQLSVVHSDPEISGGKPVFRGTRVPVQALFDYLEGGETLDHFLDQFPSVSKQQALAALDLARNSVLARACSA